MGKISSLPISIIIEKVIFERFENSEKFMVGPTLLRPGPILFIVVATAVKLVAKSKLSRLIIKSETTKIAKKEAV